MNDIINVIVIFLAGTALGVLFFGALWLTVKKAVTSKKPALLILLSFVFRITIVMVGFYFIAEGNWQRLLIALVGFVIARFAVVHLTKAKRSALAKEVNHET